MNTKLAEQEPSFETGWIYSGLQEATHAYVVALVNAGEDEAALDILKRGGSRDLVIAGREQDEGLVTISVWDVLVMAEWPEYVDHAKSHLETELGAVVERTVSLPAYAVSTQERFSYFSDIFDPQFEICCVEGQRLEDMLETILAAAPTTNTEAAAAKLMMLIERYEQREERAYAQRLYTEVRLAMLERNTGCVHAPETQQAWLDRAMALPYVTSQLRVIATFIEDATMVPSYNSEQCLFE